MNNLPVNAIYKGPQVDLALFCHSSAVSTRDASTMQSNIERISITAMFGTPASKGGSDGCLIICEVIPLAAALPDKCIALLDRCFDKWEKGVKTIFVIRGTGVSRLAAVYGEGVLISDYASNDRLGLESWHQPPQQLWRLLCLKAARVDFVSQDLFDKVMDLAARTQMAEREAETLRKSNPPKQTHKNLEFFEKKMQAEQNYEKLRKELSSYQVPQ